MEKQVRFIGGSYDGFAKVVNTKSSKIFLDTKDYRKEACAICTEIYRIKEYRNDTGAYLVAFYEGKVE